MQEKIESLPVSVRDVILARPDTDISDLTVLLSSCSMQEEIESLFVSVRDVILARPDTDISDLTALLSSPRRRRMRELQLDDLTDLLQVLPCNILNVRECDDVLQHCPCVADLIAQCCYPVCELAIL